jgi:hypothetical protein
MVLFALGIYYTFRLASIDNPQWSVADIGILTLLLIYGLSTTVDKIHESKDITINRTISIILLVIVSRVGTQVNRLMAGIAGYGNIVLIGQTSFLILSLAVLGFLVPVYWMWNQRKSVDVDS